MKKWLIAAAAVLPLLLGGCSTLTAIGGTTISPQTVQTADNAVDLAISGATAYISLPRCSATVPAPCRTHATTKLLEKDVAAAQTARNNLKKLLRANNGGAIPLADYDTINAVFNTLETDVALYAK